MNSGADEKEFSLREYDALRKEISDAVAETRSVERYAVASSAAIWTWLLVQPSDAAWIAKIKWIPFIFCLLAALRSIALLMDIVKHGKYIKTVEAKWGSGEAFRWETFIEDKRWYLTVSAILIWGVLLFGNLYAACEINASWFVLPVK